jgi:hypothetical protein
MHAATVDLLVQKAHLDSDTALAIATAIDMALHNAQLVTVAVLDARFLAFDAKIDGRFAAAEARMEARFAAAEAKMEARFAAAEAKTEARFAAAEVKTESRFTALEAKMDVALQKTKAELVGWVFLVMLGNVALSVAANAVLNAFQHLR